jgi:hypothetical protein
MVVVAELTEDLAVVGNGMMQIAGHLDSLALLLLDQLSNVLLGLGHVFSAARDLDARLSIALAGNVNADGQLRLELLLGLTAAANEAAVLLNGDLKNLGDLVLALLNDLLDPGADLLNDAAAALDLDGVAVGILLGELDGAGKLAAIVRTTGSKNNLAEGRACDKLAHARKTRGRLWTYRQIQ